MRRRLVSEDAPIRGDWTTLVVVTVVNPPGTVTGGGLDPLVGATVFGAMRVVVMVEPDTTVCPGSVIGGGAWGTTVPVVVVRAIDGTTDVDVITTTTVDVSSTGTGV